MLSYNSYNKSTKNDTQPYACKNCGSIKQKDICVEKWGVENYFQLDRTKEKIKSTNLEKYGVEHYAQTEECKKRTKETNLEKFGVDNCTKSKDIIKKRKESNFLKYGVEEPITLPLVRGKNITDAERGFIRIQEGLPYGYTVIESDKNYYYKIMCSKGHIFEISKSVLYLRKKDNIEICNQCNEYKGSIG